MSNQSDDEEHENEALEELKRKQHHPYRLHPELWYNEKGEVCDFKSISSFWLGFLWKATICWWSWVRSKIVFCFIIPEFRKYRKYLELMYLHIASGNIETVTEDNTRVVLRVSSHPLKRIVYIKLRVGKKSMFI